MAILVFLAELKSTVYCRKLERCYHAFKHISGITISAAAVVLSLLPAAEAWIPWY